MKTNDLVAAKIKEQRVKKGYSAEYVATQLKISRTAYSQLENGKVEITFNRVEALAEILEIPLSSFLPNNSGAIVIANNNATGFIGNQIHNYTDPDTLHQMQSTILLLQKLVDKMK